MKTISDAAPAAFIAAASAFVAVGATSDSAALERIQQLSWPWWLVWILTLLLGSIMVVVVLSGRLGTSPTQRPKPSDGGVGFPMVGGSSH
jgi:hypothetical protein